MHNNLRRLVWTSGAAAVVQAHAIRSVGQEAVGVLLGVRKATSAVCLRNTAAGPTDFRVERAEWQRTENYAKRLNVNVVALYHSHPTGDLALSQADKAAITLSTVPWVVIAKVKGQWQARAFAFGSGEPIQLQIESARQCNSAISRITTLALKLETGMKTQPMIERQHQRFDHE